MSETPLVVIADDYRMARFYAREHELGREGQDWRYVSEPRQLLGYPRGSRYVRFTAGNLTGIALLRSVELNAVLRQRGWVPIA